MDGSSTIHFSACPHDCPSTCALEVERFDARSIGRIRGARENDYTLGVVCAKVARYAERIHHPDRLLHPLVRTGPKGSGRFEQISWEAALDLCAEKFLGAEARLGPEAVWPYYYAGTMGLVQRDGINRLRHAKGYSGFHATICTTLSWNGFIAGTGKLAGADPREMAKADLLVIWGTNPASTQVNVMTHAIRARRERGARLVVIDVYRNETAKQADRFLCVRPGTDGALACAIMHVLFRDGHADRAYLEAMTDAPAELEAHLAPRTPEWAAAICGVPAAEIEALAGEIGRTKRTYLRLGYGFARQRNGAVNMHAASCIAAVTGAWQHEGGGAFHNNGAIYGWDKSLIEGLDRRDPDVRLLDQTRIGSVLAGNPADLQGGPPVTAMLIQNTNPMMVAPEHLLVRAGFEREDLFVCVHEQFMTATARMADLVLPATMFLEHDDIYQGGGHSYVIAGPKLIEPPGACWSNHEVTTALAKRLGVTHPGYAMTAAELADETLRRSGYPGFEELKRDRWTDAQPDFRTAHYLDGFAWPDGKFRFKPDWHAFAPQTHNSAAAMPRLPDHWDVIDNATADKPFRMATSPAHGYLNSSFTETPTSQQREGRPTVMIHPEDAAALGIADGERTRVGNEKASVVVHAQHFDGVRRGVVIVESIWPHEAFEEGLGINALTSADAAPPVGGGVFHDTAVWVRAA
ncbi:MAG: molybdopterin oxidoreductase family protein [Alphaproteobacteria bacterium]|nr:molybdopterin oxidoreductase family protein [Alphaproteobacteria bacterium]